MGALQQMDWEECLLEPVRDREAERYVRKRLRTLPHAAPYLFPSPWLTRALVSLDISRLPIRCFPVDFHELVALVVSQDNACRYCYAATRSVLKILGFPETRIRRLEEDLLAAELSAAEQAALAFARRVSRANPLATRADAEPLLRLGYTVEAVKELTFLAAVNVFYNRVATLPALPTAVMEQLADRWQMRLLRPLVARFLRGGHRPEWPRHLTAEQQAAPFAQFALAFEGLPVAGLLCSLIDDAWSSGALSRRAKGLVFAVVARGLGCPLSEREAARLLAAEGVPAVALQSILANLGAPDLDPLEAQIVPFARETIWYRPVEIQRRARELRRQVSLEQFVDLIGTAALANAVCRLSAALDLSRGPD